MVVRSRSGKLFDVEGRKATDISKPKTITKWNVLALMTVLIGLLLTLSLDQLWLAHWVSSGQAFPIGERLKVNLPAGQSLVYYQSPHSVPSDNVTLFLYDLDGNRNRIPIRFPSTNNPDISFRTRFTGISGRALWQLNLEQAGEYRFIAANGNVLSDSEIPIEDQVVFLKVPDTLNESQRVQKIIRIVGASSTFVMMAFFYVLHFLALSKQRQPAPLDEFEEQFL